MNDRESGSLFVDGTNMNLALAASGFVKVLEKKFEGMQVSKWHDEYFAAAEEVKKKSKGVFNPDQTVLENHRRKFTSSQSEDFKAQDLLEKAKKAAGPVRAIVEYVFNACSFNLYIDSFSVQIKLNLNHVHTPA